MVVEPTTAAMKRRIASAFRSLGVSIRPFDRAAYNEGLRRQEISTRFRSFTMVPEPAYIENLELASLVSRIPGDVVECGVWRGGMIAGIAAVLGGDRKYWLFDSFEGLPPAQEIDGTAAIRWQGDPQGEWYHDNCTADESSARQAMKLSGSKNVMLVKGWFQHTLVDAGVAKIALLRLDGDWYESTTTCLEAFYQKIADGGITIIDDYYQWDGCSRAVHDFLSRHSIADRIQQGRAGTAYIVKSVAGV